MRLVVATRSAHKLREIRAILGVVPELELLGLDEAGVPRSPKEEDIERFSTFEENARAKAAYFREGSEFPVLADDSGLEVDALGGQPGVKSKRFSVEGRGLDGAARDQANNRHLVSLLEDTPPEARTARYVCVAVLDQGDGTPVAVRGEAEGLIVSEPRGDGGFGYDPHFLDPELGKTFAELSPPAKDARSHRGKAFRALARLLTTQEAE
jgi:XTP/dITP diphosphohydrolase